MSQHRCMFVLNSLQQVFFHLEETLLKGTQFNSRQARIKNKENMGLLVSFLEGDRYFCLFIWEYAKDILHCHLKGIFYISPQIQMSKHKIKPFNPIVIFLKQCHKNIAQAINNGYLKEMRLFCLLKLPYIILKIETE